MTEASLTRKLLQHLEKALPGAVVLKTSDRVTKGIPDVYVAWNGRQVWIEVKVLRKGETPASRVSKPKDRLQLFTMQRLDQQTAGCAWYVLYDMRTRDTVTAIYSPRNITRPERDEFDQCTALAGGFDHQAVARLVEAVA